MKYKHKLIQHIKEKYGVSELFFFKAWRKNANNNRQNIVICSLDEDVYKEYRNYESELYIICKMRHDELETLLSTLAANSRYVSKGHPTVHNPVLFVPYGMELNDLISLKSAYLMTYLSGI